jgi:hypothetical protein
MLARKTGRLFLRGSHVGGDGLTGQKNFFFAGAICLRRMSELTIAGTRNVSYRQSQDLHLAKPAKEGYLDRDELA